MRKNNIMTLAFACCICVLISGCGKETKKITGVTVREETVSSNVPKTVAAEEPELLAMELVPPQDDPETNLAGLLQENGLSAMVQLEAGGYIGSGIILTQSEGELLILTAAHVLEKADGYVRITFPDDYCMVSRQYLTYEADDIGIVYVSLSLIPEENLANYRHAVVDYDRYDALEKEDVCIAMGSLSGVAEEAYEGRVLDPWIYVEDYGQYMIWAQCAGKPGMSGGGLFDREGYLIGVLSGVNEDGQLVAVPLNVIRNFVYGILNISL